MTVCLWYCSTLLALQARRWVSQLLYPCHTGGAVPLVFGQNRHHRIVTPPVVFHSFSRTRHTRIAEEPPRDRFRVASLLFRDCTALRWWYCSPCTTAVMAVPRRSHSGLAQPAVALRKFWTCSKFPPCHHEGPQFWFWQFSAVLRRSMMEPLRCHGGLCLTSTPVASRLRCDGGITQ